MSAAGMKVYSGHAGNAVGTFAATTLVGFSGSKHVKIDSDGVKISGSAGNYTFVSGSGMSVFSGGVQVGMFGANTTLTGGTMTIQSTAGTTGHDRLVLGSANMSMYTNNTRRLHIDDFEGF